MYEAALPRLFGLFLARQNAVRIDGRELTKFLSQLFRSGFAVGINRAGGTGPPRSFGLVIRGGAKGDTPKIVERLLRAGMPIRLAVQDIQKPGGRTVHELGTSPDRSVAWWTEQDDLVVSLISPTGPDAIIDALEGRATNAIAHPNRQALLRSEDAGGFEPVGLAFFDMAALPPLPSKAVSLGLDRIKRFDYRWGFQGESLLSIVGAVVPAPRTGIPAIFDQPTFDSRHLPPLPNGLGGFTVVSLDGARVAARIRESLAVLADPPGDNIPAPEQVGEALRAFLGVSLNDEIFAHLGSRFTIYNVATRINAPSHILESTARVFSASPRWRSSPRSRITTYWRSRSKSSSIMPTRRRAACPCNRWGSIQARLCDSRTWKTVIAGRPSGREFRSPAPRAHAASGPEDARSRLHSRHGAKGARSGGEPARGGAAVRQSTDEQARLASRQLDVAQRRRYGAVGLSRAHRGIAQAARIHDRKPDGLPVHDADEFRSKGWRAGSAGSGARGPAQSTRRRADPRPRRATVVPVPVGACPRRR